MTIADRVKELREQQGLSQEKLANMIGLKDKSSIAKIEKSGDKITSKNVEKLSEAFGCSIAYLMGWQENIDDYEHELEKLSENMKNDKLMRLVDYYSQLSSTDQDLIENMIKSLASKKE